MIGLILTLALIGLVLYLIETYIPMAAPIKLLIRVVIVVVVVLWLVRVLGIADVPIPRVGR